MRVEEGDFLCARRALIHPLRGQGTLVACGWVSGVVRTLVNEQIVVVGLQRPGDSYLDQFAGPVVLGIGDGQYVGVAIISSSDALPLAALGSSSSGGALERDSRRARRYRARGWTRSLRLENW